MVKTLDVLFDQYDHWDISKSEFIAKVRELTE